MGLSFLPTGHTPSSHRVSTHILPSAWKFLLVPILLAVHPLGLKNVMKWVVLPYPGTLTPSTSECDYVWR